MGGALGGGCPKGIPYPLAKISGLAKTRYLDRGVENEH